MISMKQSKMMTALKCLMNWTKMLKGSLMGPTKNLHVKTGVTKILLVTIALHICANSLFFIDLYLKVIHLRIFFLEKIAEKEIKRRK